MRRWIIWVVRSMWALIARLVPAGEIPVLCSVPDFDDTTRAMSVDLLDAYGALTVIVEDVDATPPPWFPARAKLVSRKSVSGVLAYLRAPVVYVTHGLYGCPPPSRGRQIVNLWHGMTIKRIDRATGGTPWPFDFSVATSDTFAQLLAMSFEVPDSDVVAIGLPRNDILSARGLPDALAVRKELCCRGYLVMLPTYRSTDRTAHQGGDNESLSIVPELRDRLSAILERHDLALLVKPHPQSPPTLLDSWLTDRIVAIDDDWLRRRDLTLYGVLAEAETLITDFSSVAVDFIATGRRALLFQPDLDQYATDRGLAMPAERYESLGDAVASVEALIEAIQGGMDDGFVRRSPAHWTMWTASFGGASQRVIAEARRRQDSGRART